MQRTKTLTIVIPAYNEAKTIGQLLDKVRAAALLNGIRKEIIVVDDCSEDNTVEIVSEYMRCHQDTNIIFRQHQTNQGKGAALHTGIEQATGDYLIVQDADLEYDPNEYRILLQPMVDGVADVVYGSRFMGGNAHRILFFWHTIGNKFLTFLSNMFTNLNLTDMNTCYKMFRTELLQHIHLREKRFGFDPEITAKMSQFPNIRIYEVGISYYGRTYAEGKKINWLDGFRSLYCICRYNLFHQKKYPALSPTVPAHHLGPTEHHEISPDKMSIDEYVTPSQAT